MKREVDRILEVNRPYCCKVGCGADAEWTIWSGSRDVDYTHACTAHVGELLTDVPEHRVFPLARQTITRKS